MDVTRVYFLGDRVWWAAALFLGPIVGAMTGQVGLAIVTVFVLVLPTVIVFDSDRPWWPDDVKRLPQDAERSRAETRRLTVTCAIGLACGLAVAILGPWG